MNLKEIKEMIQLMNENSLNELELERNGLKIRLVKEQKTVVRDIQKTAGDVLAVTPELKPQVSVTAQKAEYLQIKSPMVGTFYRAAGPDASPFVEIGGAVNPGDVVCIIEAMKLMNEIKSEVKGKVKEVLIENGEPVEFGQVLFLIEPE